MDPNYWLRVCREAGEKVFTEVNKILEKEERRKVLKVGYGGDETLLIDDIAEKTIFNHFKSTGKSFEFISEEMGIKKVGDRLEVVVAVDPLDGSNNMNYGLLIASTSIAIGDLSKKIGGIKLGYVKDLISGNEYHAIEGKGAFKNRKQIKVRKERNGCILVDIAKGREGNFQKIVKIGKNFRSVRMLGSGTLSMCLFAEGISDACLYLGSIRTLDTAASQLIAREAGAIVKDIHGKDFTDYDTGFNIDLNLIGAINENLYHEIRSLLGD